VRKRLLIEQDICKARTVVYTFFSRIFSEEIDKDALENMDYLPLYLRIYGEKIGSMEIIEASSALENFFAMLENKNQKEVLLDLARSYAKLFLGASEKIVPLWESVYVGQKKLLYQQSFFEVLDYYKRFGFEKRKEFREPEDHLAVELYFMKKLSELLCEEKNASQLLLLAEAQLEFLRTHLLRWIPVLVTELDKHDDYGFYRLVGNALIKFLRSDESWLKKIIESY